MIRYRGSILAIALVTAFLFFVPTAFATEEHNGSVCIGGCQNQDQHQRQNAVGVGVGIGQGGAGGAGGSGGSASSNASADNEGVKQKTDVKVENDYPVSSAYAPALTSGPQACLGSVSGGVSTSVVGVAFGSTMKDEDCIRRLNSDAIFRMGVQQNDKRLVTAALYLLAQNSDVAKALKDAGVQMAKASTDAAQQQAKAEQQVPATADSKRPGNVYPTTAWLSGER